MDNEVPPLLEQWEMFEALKYFIPVSIVEDYLGRKLDIEEELEDGK